MTMIGIVARRRNVEILTDSIAYNENGRHVWTAPKHVTHLANIATAVITQGDVEFAELWRETVSAVAGRFDSFDSFAGSVEHLLPRAYEHAGRPAGVGVPAVFHVGYSPSAGGFVALGYGLSTGWARHVLGGLYIMPAPLTHRPGPFEAARVLSLYGASEELDQWAAKDPYPAPDTTAEWVELARACYTTRALPWRWSRIMIGGDVHLHRLTRDGLASEQIHAFTDPDEFRQMVYGTAHPLSQTAPCPCGSGQQVIDCCWDRAAFAEPCDCGSGVPFGGCCSIYAEDRQPVA